MTDVSLKKVYAAKWVVRQHEFDTWFSWHDSLNDYFQEKDNFPLYITNTVLAWKRQGFVQGKTFVVPFEQVIRIACERVVVESE